MDVVSCILFRPLYHTPFTVNQVKNTPEDYINKLIIWILNSLVTLKFNIELIFLTLDPLALFLECQVGLILKKSVH